MADQGSWPGIVVHHLGVWLLVGLQIDHHEIMIVCASLREFGLPQRSKAIKACTMLRALGGILSHLLNMAFERYLRNLAVD